MTQAYDLSDLEESQTSQVDLSDLEQPANGQEVVRQQQSLFSPRDVTPLLGQAVREIRSTVGPPPSFPEDVASRFLSQTPIGQMASAPFTRQPTSRMGKAVSAGMTAAPFLVAAGMPARAVGKAAGEVGGGLGTVFSERKQVDLARHTRQIFEQVKRGSGPAFEASMKQLPGSVNVEPEITKILDMVTHPEHGMSASTAVGEAMANAAKMGDTTLQRFLETPDLAQIASALEAHQVATTLRQTPSMLRILQQNPNIAQSGAKTLSKLGAFDTAFQDVAHQVTGKLEQAYPDIYPQIVGQYGNIQQGARLLTPAFSARGNQLIKNIKSGFGGGEVAAMAKEVLPESTSKRLFGVAKAQKAVNAINPLFWLKKAVGR